MEPRPKELPAAETWPIRRAEELIASLTGVVSARIVARPGGEIEEIHVLTTEEVSAKQAVRNVESALLAELGVAVDHRKISVAQTRDGRNAAADLAAVAAGAAGAPALPRRFQERRLVFVGHEIQRERNHRVAVRVAVRWGEQEFTGEAAGMDLSRARLEVTANATLRAIEAAVEHSGGDEEKEPITFALDGVKTVEAFDRAFVLVGVHALRGRELLVLAGAAGLGENPERATILATLQATDRWVRGQL